MSEARSEERQSRQRDGLLRKREPDRLPWVELSVAGAACLAVAQPLLDLLGRSPQFFVARSSSRLELVALALVLSWLLPLAAATLVAAARALGPGCHHWAGGVLFGVAVSSIVARTLRAAALPDATWLLAALAAPAVAVPFARSASVRQLGAVLALSLLATPALFLSTEPIRALTTKDPEAPGIATSRATASAPVFFLLFDEWPLFSILGPDGNVDERRYPNLARLAATATWYRNAYSVDTSTERAVPAIVTGRFSHFDRSPRWQEYPESLFSLLGGYQLYCSESITDLCPDSKNLFEEPTRKAARGAASLLSDLGVLWLHQVLPASQRRHLPAIDQSWGDYSRQVQTLEDAERARLGNVGALGRGERVEQWRAFLDAIDARSDPELYFAHLLLPHVPWEYLPNGRRYATASIRPPGVDDREVWIDDGSAREGLVRFLLQSEYLDREIGRFLDRLEELELFERSLIVVVADHGAAFRAGAPRRAPAAGVESDVLSVPLFLKAPGQSRAEVVDEPFPLVRLLERVMAALGEPFEPDPAVAGLELDRVVVQDWQGLRRLPAGILDQRFASASDLHRLFGAGPPDPYRLRPYSELVGRPTSELEKVSSKARARVQAASLYRSVDPRLAIDPSYLRGGFEASEESLAAVAVALDGVVVGTGPVRDEEGEAGDLRGSFTALLDPEALSPGDHRLEVYGISHDPRDGELWLRTLGLEHERRFEPLAGDDPPRLRDDRGQSYPLDPQVIGALSLCRLAAGSISLAGWSADLREEARIRELALFVGDRFLLSETHLPHPVAAHGKDDGGFLIELDRELAPEFPSSPFRLFAISDRGVAGFLEPSFDLLVAESDRGTTLADGCGRRLPVERAGERAGIDQLGARPGVGRVMVGGWVETASGQEPAGRPPILRVDVFRNGERVASHPVDQERPDVVGTGSAVVGFRFPLRRPIALGLLDGSTRLVVVDPGRFGVAAQAIEPAMTPEATSRLGSLRDSRVTPRR